MLICPSYHDFCIYYFLTRYLLKHASSLFFTIHLFQNRVIRIAPFANRLAMNVPSHIQLLRCITNYRALRFAAPITTLAQKLVNRMIVRSSMTGGKYVSVHLRFEEVLKLIYYSILSKVSVPWNILCWACWGSISYNDKHIPHLLGHGGLLMLFVWWRGCWKVWNAFISGKRVEGEVQKKRSRLRSWS